MIIVIMFIPIVNRSDGNQGVEIVCNPFLSVETKNTTTGQCPLFLIKY